MHWDAKVVQGWEGWTRIIFVHTEAYEAEERIVGTEMAKRDRDDKAAQG